MSYDASRNDLEELFKGNQGYSKHMSTHHPTKLLEQLAREGQPGKLNSKPLIAHLHLSYRLSEQAIFNTKPGTIFTTHNIANVFVEDDVTSAAALRYAVEILKVRHVIVIGHYGCGGIAASMVPPLPTPQSPAECFMDVGNSTREGLPSVEDAARPSTGKECQSTAWSEGHRFWCSARDGGEDGVLQAYMQVMDETGELRVKAPNGDKAAAHGLDTQASPRAERAARRERERQRRLRDLGHDIAQRPPGFVIDPILYDSFRVVAITEVSDISTINGEKLLQVQDDGGFLNVMREYFASLDQSAHPSPRSRAITRFQELLLIPFREFSVITEEMILSERKRFQNEIIHNIKAFSKRAVVRNLKTLGRFSKEQAGLIYNALYKAMCIEPAPPATAPPPSLFTTNDGHEGKPESRIGLRTFRHFLSEIATWARDEKMIVMNGLTVTEHEFIDRLFYFWDTSCRGALSFQDLVSGLDGVMLNDLMENIEWFLNLHDKNKDRYLTKDEVLTLSESLLFIFRFRVGDAYLGAVSRFMSNAFEYDDTLLPQNEGRSGEETSVETNQPYINDQSCNVRRLSIVLLELDDAIEDDEDSDDDPFE
ncbi:hypothetical protein F5887DRAFT_1228861 [Amanita rubescens]|nr:hypothetical protein F5887DRAFT_1228861 [Amanita rubescens]